ncbi:hypothetical protein NK6_2589 [Bradyrhizobium diazoefficiens]|uniref:Uncharacterized protein n=1 Tax=Bradyrhizobium diazoefficiens TaxID=1355477 RepID=A0A0E3VTJ5_9BRAD|nr:hypothetical protein NK6_2589 [Bradyrhizobium diazoefficiens]
MLQCVAQSPFISISAKRVRNALARGGVDLFAVCEV